MMATLPAICGNPTCRNVFPSGYGLEGGAIYSGNQSGPCPKCGSMGYVPDGKYEAAQTTILGVLDRVQDVQILKTATQVLKSELDAGKSPEQIKQKVSEEIPELKTLWDLIPKKRTEAYTVIGIILAMLALAPKYISELKSKPSHDEPTIQYIDDSYKEFYRLDLGNHLVEEKAPHTQQQTDETSSDSAEQK